MMPGEKHVETVSGVPEVARAGSVARTERVLRKIERVVPQSRWNTVVVQSDGSVRVHFKEDAAGRETHCGRGAGRAKAFQRKIWLSAKQAKWFKNFLFLSGKRMSAMLRRRAFLMWGSWCLAHLRAVPDWTPRKEANSTSGFGEKNPGLKLPSQDDVDHEEVSVTGVSTAGSASENADGASRSSAGLAVDSSASTQSSANSPATRSKVGKKKKK